MTEKTVNAAKPRIPVCVPLLTGRELEYVTNCINTNWISSRGKYVEDFEKKFADYCDCKYGISTTNGTTALHLALASLNLKAGDEVIVPSFTIVSTVFAIIYCGAKPVVVDSDPETWNIDVARIEEKISKKTKILLPVHIYGHPCDMDPIIGLAKKYGLHVVEDASEVHGAEYKGRKAGGIGDIGCFSFYANKIITCGEGGMITTSNKEIADHAASLKDLSFTGENRVYLHSEVGFNYRLTNLQAAIGLAQFEQIDKFVEMRRKNAHLYNQRLKSVAGITLPTEKPWAKNVYWMYSVLVEPEFGLRRDDLIVKLKERGVETRSFFIPMHKQPVFKNMGLFKNESYPVAEALSKKGLYLPSSSGLTSDEIDYVCTSIEEIQRESKKK